MTVWWLRITVVYPMGLLLLWLADTLLPTPTSLCECFWEEGWKKGKEEKRNNSIDLHLYQYFQGASLHHSFPLLRSSTSTRKPTNPTNPTQPARAARSTTAILHHPSILWHIACLRFVCCARAIFGNRFDWLSLCSPFTPWERGEEK
ncbi:hypothetical protein HOY82DRAFT_556005 [Tuber indicum]|nr:hypothetical protein HOY82DRAFT_556005 [Tuber indicum]